MTQYGFFIDQSRCIGCNGCFIACKQWHDLRPGPVKWMRIYQWEKGAYPNTRLHILPIMCLHCENPVCVKACPNNAIFKESRFGAVLVDTERCTGTRKCWKACPYGAPQFDGDEPGLQMSKCTMCIDRLEQGLKPICVLSCSMRALEFGPLEELEAKYGTVKSLEEMPKASITRPAVVFKPIDPKKSLIQWDSAKAMKLWQKRQPSGDGDLPDIFTDAAEVFEENAERIGRHRLALKAPTAQELMYYTTDDE